MKALNHRRMLAVTALTITGLIATACSSNSGDSAGGGASNSKAGATQTASTPPGNPIRLGTIGSYSGANASSFGKLPDVVNAWVQSVNAAGGVNGHPIKMTIKDDSGDPAKALQAAKELVQSDHVIAVVGAYSTVDDSFAKYLEQQNVPIIGGNPNNTVQFTNPNIFPSGSNVVTGIAGELDVMKQNNLKNFGLMYCAEAPVCAQLGDLAKGLATLFPGVTVKYTGKVAATSPNYDATCLAAKNAGIDTLMVAGNSSIDQRVAENCKQVGLNAKPINTASSATSEWLKSSALQGMYLIGPNANYVDTTVAGVAAFNTALKKYAPGIPGTKDFVQADLYTWAGGKLFEAAAKAAKIGPTSTGADLKKGLYALKDETLDGISAPLNYVQGKPTFLSCFFTQQIKNQQFVALNDDKPTCLTPAQVAGIGKILAGK